MSDDLGTTAQPAQGLADNAAGAIAYITIVPAVIFLLMAPYNTRPFVKFHAWQNIGLIAASVVLYIFLLIFSLVIMFIPYVKFLLLLIYPVFGLALFVVWLLCVLKAYKGSAFKLPLISGLATKQSGYNI